MKLLIDMNLSSEWVRVLGEKGFEALHWSQIGMPNAPDHEIMAWGKANGYILFTHDLDFGAILEKGALISIDEAKSRVHILPLIE